MDTAPYLPAQLDLYFEQLLLQGLFNYSLASSDAHEHVNLKAGYLLKAIEKILQARLLREHWSFLLQRPTRHSLEDLLLKKAPTLGAEQICQRLHQLCPKQFPLKYRARIGRVIKHTRCLLAGTCAQKMPQGDYPERDLLRAKMREERKACAIHSTTLQRDLVSCWRMLRDLMQYKWTQYFAAYTTHFDRLEANIQPLRQQLANHAWLKHLKQKSKQPRHWLILRKCAACGHKSYILNTIFDSLIIQFESFCSCCDYVSDIISCENCENLTEADVPCRICAHSQSADQCFDPRKCMEASPTTPYCPGCDNNNLQALQRPGHYYCPDCHFKFNSHDYVKCRFCLRYNYGLLDQDLSYLQGCNHCSGLHGYFMII